MLIYVLNLEWICCPDAPRKDIHAKTENKQLTCPTTTPIRVISPTAQHEYRALHHLLSRACCAENIDIVDCHNLLQGVTVSRLRLQPLVVSGAQILPAPCLFCAAGLDLTWR